jgi:integrase
MKEAMAQVETPVAMALSFSELVKAYLAVIPDNTDYHTRKFMDVFGDQSAWEISPADLSRAAQAMIESGYKPCTVNRNLSAIGMVYAWAKKKHLCPAGFISPTLSIKRYEEEARVVHIAVDQVKRLLDGAAGVKDRRFGVFVRLLYESGARRGEIMWIKWKDVDLDKGEITCMMTKTGKPRVLFFTREVVELMRRIWPKRDPEALVFEGKVTRLRPIDYRCHWRDLTKAIGCTGLHLHDLRHHRAAELLKAGNTIAVAAQVLGHSSNVLQRRYGHLETAHLKQATELSWGRAA